MRCYICNREISENPTSPTQCKAHGEHIIHNGIRGKLISRTILCEKCGSAYSREDAAFCKIFDAIMAPLSDRLVPSDHGSDTAKVLKGGLYEAPNGDPDGPNREVIVKDGVAAPLQPYYEIEGDKIVVYAEKNRIKQFINVVTNELKANGKDIADYTVEKVTDIHDKGYLAYYFSKDNENFNRDFKCGIVKIATEYALECGISREQLRGVLVIHDDGTAEIDYENAKLIPFVPASMFDFIFEDSRYKLEDGYPSHSLKLFSTEYADGKSILYCYIDLFSTFQYYVVLDENYRGEEISKLYAQRLIPRTTEKPDVSQFDPSDLDIVIREYGIDMSLCTDTSYAGQLKYVQHCIRKYPPHNYDFQKALGNACERVTHCLMSYWMGLKGMMPTNIANIIGAHLDGRSRTDIALLPEAFEQAIAPEYYRKCSFDVIDGEVMCYSQPDECLRVFNQFNEMVKKYAHAKFSQLSYLCHNPKSLDD